MPRRLFGGLWVEQHVEMRGPHPGDVRRTRAHRPGHVHLDAHFLDQCGDLGQVVAVAEAERSGAEDVAADLLGPGQRPGEMADDLEEGLVSAEVLLALVGGQVQRDHRAGQAERLGQAAGVVLDQLGGAGRTDDHRLGAEALIGVARRRPEQVRGVGAEVARLEGGIGDGRALGAPLDHREEQVRIGVALRGMQDVVQPLHSRCHAHRADMGRAFICPDGQLHSAASSRCPGDSSARRRSGREKRPARSPACS